MIDYEIKKILLKENKPISDFYLLKEYIKENKLSNTESIKFVNKYAKGDYPLQYLVGFEYVLNNKILINENVLIPRMETIELIYKLFETIKEKYNTHDNIKILDVGTGSGTIIIGLNQLLKNENYKPEFFATDISLDAIEVAKQNFKTNNIDVNIKHTNVYDYYLEAEEKFDVIVSNPPYIDFEDEEVDENVVKYEPHIALFALDKGLKIYKEIIDNCLEILNKEYVICFEIGYNQSESILKYASEKLGKIRKTSNKDLNGKDRIIILSR